MLQEMSQLALISRRASQRLSTQRDYMPENLPISVSLISIKQASLALQASRAQIPLPSFALDGRPNLAKGEE